MSAGEIISLVAVSLSIVTAVLGGLMWIIKAQVTHMRRDMQQPNGGSSTKDQLNRIERDVIEVRGKVDDHITWHLKD